MQESTSLHVGNHAGIRRSGRERRSNKKGNTTTIPEISLHALSRVDTPQTMHVRGMIQGKPLHILIDSGSTHNFVNFKFARKMGCCKVPAPAFHVMVANGNSCNVMKFIYLYLWKYKATNFKPMFTPWIYKASILF